MTIEFWSPSLCLTPKPAPKPKRKPRPRRLEAPGGSAKPTRCLQLQSSVVTTNWPRGSTKAVKANGYYIQPTCGNYEIDWMP